MAMDTEAMVDTMVEDLDTTGERGPLMLMLMPTMDMDTTPMPMVMLPPTTATDMLPTILARGLLMLNPDTSEDITEDTVVMDMVDTEDTTTVELLHDVCSL